MLKAGQPLTYPTFTRAGIGGDERRLEVREPQTGKKERQCGVI